MTPKSAVVDRSDHRQDDRCDQRPPGRPRNERATRAITGAALRQLREIGYAKMSMESVASEAGVARATIYRRYHDKGDLVTAAIAARINEEAPPRQSGDPRQDLIKYLRTFDRNFAESCLEILGALVGEHGDRATLDLHRQRVIEPRSAYARGLLEQARQRGELRDDADLDLALEMASGSVLYRRCSGNVAQSDWARRTVDAIWRAMGPED